MDTRKIAAENRLLHWARIIRERKESGLSVKEYCKNAGFNSNIYYYWQRRLRTAACEQLTNASAPVFTEVRMTGSSAQLPSLESVPQLRIEVAGVQISADSTYPTEKLSALLRDLGQSC